VATPTADTSPIYPLPPARRAVNAPRRLRLIDRLSTPGWVVLTGFALGLSFPPFPFHGLALVALVPLLARWSRQPALAMLFREAYAAFLIATALSGYWVLFHADTLKGLMMGAGLLAFPLLLTLPVLASSYVLRRLGLVPGLLALGCGWLAVEYLLTAGPVAFPWLLLGHTQAEALLFNQFADLGGVGGLSLWVLAVNVAVFAALRSRALTPRFAVTLVALTLVLLPVGYRGWRLSTLPPAVDTAHVVVVQPALSAQAWSEVANLDRVQLLADLSDAALGWGAPPGATTPPRPDLVVWPEAALPVFPEARLQQTLYARLSNWAARRDVPLLTGAVTRFDTAPALTVEPFLAQRAAETSPYYNSALLFDGRSTQQYDKIRMLPVADRVPAAGLVPGQVLGATRSFGVGGAQTTFRAGRFSLSTLVALEALFGDHARRAVPAGADFFAVLTNTGWWSYEGAHRQFVALARLRAVETRRALVLASVTGGSGMILPDGTTSELAGWMEHEALTVDVPVRTDLTTYVRTGDLVYRGASLVALLLALGLGMASAFRPPAPRDTKRR
jgi:apolipoprotein N-acyltransferase